MLGGKSVTLNDYIKKEDREELFKYLPQEIRKDKKLNLKRQKINRTQLTKSKAKVQHKTSGKKNEKLVLGKINKIGRLEKTEQMKKVTKYQFH